jgi:hypothetical protein
MNCWFSWLNIEPVKNDCYNDNHLRNLISKSEWVLFSKTVFENPKDHSDDLFLFLITALHCLQRNQKKYLNKQKKMHLHNLCLNMTLHCLQSNQKKYLYEQKKMHLHNLCLYMDLGKRAGSLQPAAHPRGMVHQQEPLFRWVPVP